MNSCVVREPYAEPGTGAGARAGAAAVAVEGGELNYKCKQNTPWNCGRNWENGHNGAVKSLK